MKSNVLRVLLWTLAALPALTGCKSGMDAAAFEQPARAPQLDLLERFVGTWESTIETKVEGAVGEAEKGTGLDTISWDVNKRLLVDRFSGELGSMGKMQGLGIWTWDAKLKKFRTLWFDDWGALASGVAWYDAKSSSWKMKGTSRNMVTGEKMIGEGEVQFIDDNTQKWTYREWVPFPLLNWKLSKAFEMNGTSKRK